MMYAIAMYFVGWYCARSDHRKGRLSTTTSLTSIYIVTIAFGLAFAVWGVTGTPHPLTVIAVPIAYHFEAKRLRNDDRTRRMNDLVDRHKNQS